MRGGWISPLLVCVGALVTATAARADDAAPPPLSPAQIALFESDHLKNIQHPDRLEYRFSREAGSDALDKAGGGYVDRVELDLRPRDDSKKDVWVVFLSGEHHVPFPPLSGFQGNPVLMFFLERDVSEMQQHLGGAASYFRRRLREAFLDRAQVKPVEVTRDGTTVPGTEITLTPFTDDPRIAGFPGVKDKIYRFVLSEGVPGGIYEIASEVPGEAGQAPSVRETMIFAGEHPCEASEGPCQAAGGQ